LLKIPFKFTNVNPKCEKIRIKMCADIQYNMTIYPNLLKHTKQEEAESDIEQLRKFLIFLRNVFVFCGVVGSVLV